MTGRIRRSCLSVSQGNFRKLPKNFVTKFRLNKTITARHILKKEKLRFKNTEGDDFKLLDCILTVHMKKDKCIIKTLSTIVSGFTSTRILIKQNKLKIGKPLKDLKMLDKIPYIKLSQKTRKSTAIRKNVTSSVDKKEQSTYFGLINLISSDDETPKRGRPSSRRFSNVQRTNSDKPALKLYLKRKNSSGHFKLLPKPTEKTPVASPIERSPRKRSIERSIKSSQQRNSRLTSPEKNPTLRKSTRGRKKRAATPEAENQDNVSVRIERKKSVKKTKKNFKLSFNKKFKETTFSKDDVNEKPKCIICNKMFKTFVEFQLHVLQHDKRGEPEVNLVKYGELPEHSKIAKPIESGDPKDETTQPEFVCVPMGEVVVVEDEIIAALTTRMQRASSDSSWENTVRNSKTPEITNPTPEKNGADTSSIARCKKRASNINDENNPRKRPKHNEAETNLSLTNDKTEDSHKLNETNIMVNETSGNLNESRNSDRQADSTDICIFISESNISVDIAPDDSEKIEDITSSQKTNDENDISRSLEEVEVNNEQNTNDQETNNAQLMNAFNEGDESTLLNSNAELHETDIDEHNDPKRVMGASKLAHLNKTDKSINSETHRDNEDLSRENSDTATVEKLKENGKTSEEASPKNEDTAVNEVVCTDRIDDEIIQENGNEPSSLTTKCNSTPIEKESANNEETSAENDKERTDETIKNYAQIKDIDAKENSDEEDAKDSDHNESADSEFSFKVVDEIDSDHDESVDLPSADQCETELKTQSKSVEEAEDDNSAPVVSVSEDVEQGGGDKSPMPNSERHYDLDDEGAKAIDEANNSRSPVSSIKNTDEINLKNVLNENALTGEQAVSEAVVNDHDEEEEENEKNSNADELVEEKKIDDLEHCIVEEEEDNDKNSNAGEVVEESIEKTDDMEHSIDEEEEENEKSSNADEVIEESIEKTDDVDDGIDSNEVPKQNDKLTTTADIENSKESNEAPDENGEQKKKNSHDTEDKLCETDQLSDVSDGDFDEENNSEDGDNSKSQTNGSDENRDAERQLNDLYSLGQESEGGEEDNHLHSTDNLSNLSLRQEKTNLLEDDDENNVSNIEDSGSNKRKRSNDNDDVAPSEKKVKLSANSDIQSTELNNKIVLSNYSFGSSISGGEGFESCRDDMNTPSSYSDAENVFFGEGNHQKILL